MCYQQEAQSAPVVQGMHICLSVRGTGVRSLVWEDSMCCGATQPKSHNCQGWVLQPLKPMHEACRREATTVSGPCTTMKSGLHTPPGGSPSAGVKTQDTKKKQVLKKKGPTLIQDKLDFKTTCINQRYRGIFYNDKGIVSPGRHIILKCMNPNSRTSKH